MFEHTGKSSFDKTSYLSHDKYGSNGRAGTPFIGHRSFPSYVFIPEEAAQMVTIANTILINIGTPSKEANETMLIAARTARNLGKPAILDPVGYGATKARIDFVETLLETGAFTIIKGNGAEISLLAGERAEVRGVDSVGSPLAAIAARKVAARYNCVAAATGPVDYVSDGTKVYSLKSGHEWLTKVSGSGCWVGTLMAACASVADPCQPLWQRSL